MEPIARNFDSRYLKGDLYTRSKPLRGKKCILLACFPKSGSTYLSKIISSYENFRKVDLVPSYGNREQELDIRKLHQNKKYNYIAQQHVRSSFETEKLINQFELKTIILVRNIYDIIPSLRDHLIKEGLPLSFISCY